MTKCKCRMKFKSQMSNEGSFTDGRDDFLSGVGEVIGGCQLDAAFAKDLFAFFDFGAFEANDEGDVEANGFAGGNDGRGDGRAAGNAAEDVDEDAFDVRVGKDDA